jgi:hypothetical protein
VRLTIDQRLYSTYIASAQWATKRRQALEHHGHYCPACGTTQDLHVHHRTYQNLGREHMDDLIPLCTACHQGVHDLADTGMDLAEATDQLLASQPAATPTKAQPQTVSGYLRGLTILDTTGQRLAQQHEHTRTHGPTRYPPTRQQKRLIHGSPTMYDNGCRCPACQGANDFRTQHAKHYQHNPNKPPQHTPPKHSAVQSTLSPVTVTVPVNTHTLDSTTDHVSVHGHPPITSQHQPQPSEPQ